MWTVWWTKFLSIRIFMVCTIPNQLTCLLNKTKYHLKAFCLAIIPASTSPIKAIPSFDQIFRCIRFQFLPQVDHGVGWPGPAHSAQPDTRHQTCTHQYVVYLVLPKQPLYTWTEHNRQISLWKMSRKRYGLMIESIGCIQQNVLSYWSKDWGLQNASVYILNVNVCLPESQRQM